MRAPDIAAVAVVALAAAAMLASSTCHFQTTEPDGVPRCGTSAFALGSAALMAGAGLLALAAALGRAPRAPAQAALGLAGIAWAMYAVTGFVGWTLANVAYAALALAAAAVPRRGRDLALAATVLFLVPNAFVAAMTLIGAHPVVAVATVLLGLPQVLLLRAWPRAVQEP